MFKKQIPFAAMLIVCMSIAGLRAMEIEIDYVTEERLYLGAAFLALLCAIQLSSRLIRAHRSYKRP